MSSVVRRPSGVILAAGIGSRQALGDPNILKPLVPVGGRPLILRTIDSLREAGCSRVLVVLGYEAQRIEKAIDRMYQGPVKVEYVFNPRFELQNGVSLLTARAALAGEFVLAMADHVFERSIMATVAAHQCPADGATLFVDSKLDSIFDMDDATKVRVRDGLVQAIGKDLTNFNAVDCGVFLVGSALLDALEEVFRARGDVSLSDGVRILADQGRMQAVDVGSGRWQDVDDASMLTAAEALLTST